MYLKKVFLIIIIAVVCTSSVLAANNNANLIPNPGFDEFDGDTPIGYTVHSWNQEYIQEKFGSASPGRNGTGFCLELQKGWTIASVQVQSDLIPVEADTKYLFKGYYISSCQKVFITGQWLNQSEKAVGDFEIKLSETQDRWEVFFKDIHSPADAKHMQLTLKKVWQDGYVRFDDFSLRKGTVQDYADEFSLPALKPGQLRFPVFPCTTSGGGLQGEWEAECAMANFSVGQKQAKYGLLRRIHSGEVSTWPDSELVKANEDNTIWCIVGLDEPSEGQFAELAKLNERFKRLAPSKPFIVNLLPTYGFPSYQAYENHVRSFIEIVKPSFFTYDHYTLTGRASAYGRDFFANLEIVRQQVQSHEIDWGIILQLVGHMAARSPNEAELRWQAYCSLAYGPRALGWFTYDTEVEYGGVNWHDAVIERDGSRTRHYSMLRRINGEVLNLGDTLLRLKSTGVFHTKPLPELTQDITESKLIQSINKGEWVIGEFVDGSGRRYFMLVNRDFTKEQEALIAFSDEVMSLFEINKADGTQVRVTGFNQQSGTVALTVTAGDGRLFLLE